MPASESGYVVKVYDHDIDEETRTPWIEMEFLRGENLGAMVSRRNALTAPEVMAIFEASRRGSDPHMPRG